MMAYAPIVLFVYNRSWHTKRTIEALQKNELAGESELYIYSDAPKNKEDEKRVREVRSYIHKIDGFKKVTIIEREKNLGLAGSIIDGVTKVVNEYGKVIVLEDDLVTSPYFLRFMNDALEYYEDEKRVWHISGWNYPIKIKTEETNRVFLWRVMNCWGWATWADRWQFFEKDTEKLMREFSNEAIRKFNLDGVENFWEQVVLNKEGKIDTWAIYWYATIFKQQGLCLNPVRTFVDNIGFDGSGVHCSKKSFVDNIQTEYSIQFTKNIEETEVYTKAIKKYLRKGILTRVKRLIPIWK